MVLILLSLLCLGLPPLAAAPDEPKGDGTVTDTAVPVLAPAPPIILSYHLLDRLAEGTIDAGGGKGTAPKGVYDGTYFQPFWHSTGPDEIRKFHRRVLTHNGKLSMRDMREAVVVPAPAVVTLPLTPRENARLVVTPVVMKIGSAPGTATLSIRCRDGTTEQTLLNREVTPIPQGEFKEWPPADSIALPAACTELTLETATEKQRSGAWVIWQDPRVEVAVPADQAPRYNIIYVVVDSLRGDAVGAGRTGFPSVSPHIDAFETTGTSFPNGFANGNSTLLSMNAMLLGAHPRAVNFLATWWSGKDKRPEFYKGRPPFVTRLLHAAGYVSFGAVHNHLFFPGYVYGVDPGFDVLQDCGKETADHPILTQRTIDFLRENRERRFFVEINLLGPHQPYEAPRENEERVKQVLGRTKPRLHRQYLAEVSWVDDHVGRLLAALDELDLRKNTIVVLTADHGEVMEPKHQCYSAVMEQGCLYLHGLTLYDDEIHVPIMLSLPGLILPQVVPDVAQHVDLVPTLLELIGLPVPGIMTGRSLVPVLLRGEHLEDVPVYAERWLARALRWKGYKLIQHTAKDDICPPAAEEVCRAGVWNELYRVADDPWERTEISKQEPDILKELLAKLDEMREYLTQKAAALGGG